MFGKRKKTKKSKKKEVLKVSKRELKKYDFEKKFQEEVIEEEIIKPLHIGHVIWADVDEEEELGNDSMEVENILLKDTKVKVRKDLDEYFVRNSDELKSEKKSKKVLKKKSQSTKFKKYYQYKKYRFETPSELIEYMEKYPKMREKMANYVLEDDAFFTWLGQNSYHFIESVKEFRTFKKNIEKS